MAELIDQLVLTTAEVKPDFEAVCFRDSSMTYSDLAQSINTASHGLLNLGLQKHERVAVYLPKQFETVISFFTVARVGGVFVPVNPILKADQVGHILKDCNARILVTSGQRLVALTDTLAECTDLHTLIIVGPVAPDLKEKFPGFRIIGWNDFSSHPGRQLKWHRVIDTDMAAILYTSGSTGNPKGVVLSHRNVVAGANSVATYLRNSSEDRLLAVLPFSFDYGFSQLTTAFLKGASVVLMDYLLPRDVIKTADRERITGLAAVPSLWAQLSHLQWPETISQNLRYITNSGGAMPLSVLNLLREKIPQTKIYLMYGLTEAFRSTYLPPEEIERRPNSMGKAIPNADILVIREDGSPCAPGEPGELVHRGSLVSLGYWNDPARTAERFKPAPGLTSALPFSEIAVWSGDTVRQDEEGFLYFIGRKDDMIKTSGYRVSPTEIEEVIYSSGLVKEAAALGLPHSIVGQAILVVVSKRDDQKLDLNALVSLCKQRLPAFMVPKHIELMENLPKNPNGKIDRKKLAMEFTGFFEDAK